MVSVANQEDFKDPSFVRFYMLTSFARKGCSSGTIERSVKKVVTADRLHQANVSQIEADLLKHISQNIPLSVDDEYMKFTLESYRAGDKNNTKKSKNSK